MNCIDLMVEEHGHIKKMLEIIRKYCYRILKGEQVHYEDFYSIIDFVRNYADKHHHGKEESMLFNRMADELGPPAEKLVKLGMLVEHDLGRLHMQELEQAVKRVIQGDDESRLDIIGNAIAYTQLLYRHIDKEDNAVYHFASSNFSNETLAKINKECEEYEQDPKSKAVREKYLSLIDELSAKI